MKKFLTLATLAALLFSGCTVQLGRGSTVYGTGAMVSRSFEVGDFSALEVGGSASFTVIFRQSDDISVEIAMQENLFDLHQISVRGNYLSLSRTNSNDTVRYGNNRPRVYIYAPTLTAININGALHTEGWDTISTPNFSITSNGLINMAASLEVDRLQLDLSGASNLDFWGNATNTSITKNGAGSIMARNLHTEDTTITLNGAGDIEIAVANTLDATLNGVGSIRYIGNPDVTQHVGALGSIRRVE
ncbi:MAG: DUF2807 domain-containing protein [Defluviitaleaceae bacterium]|nr:DUF2807 domain-containing protein [Defluviitaleaceae bacterium]